MTEDGAEPTESERPEETAGAEPDAGEVTDGTPEEGDVGGPATEGASDTGAAADAPETSDDEADLTARVGQYDEGLAEEVAALQSRVEALESQLDERDEEVEDLTSRLKRKQADFQNYKKRAKKRQEQLKDRATEDLVERVVSVRDNLVRALDQDADADIRPGVESTLEEFDRILADEGVSVVDPEPGTEVDPTRHEVMMRVAADRPEGTVVDVYEPGYEMGDRVIREAKVTVSEGTDGEDGTEGGGDGEN